MLRCSTQLRRIAVRPLLPLLLFACVTGAALPSLLVAQEDVVVFLVRHAERADDGPGEGWTRENPMMAKDPPLSQAGRARGLRLSEILQDVGITSIYSTDFRRTKETVQPLAQAKGLDVMLYDPDRLEEFAQELLARPGRHLVVGHSDTTPSLVEFLGGEPGRAIELLEYDRLYIVTPKGNGAQTLLLRFGTLYSQEPEGVTLSSGS